MLHTWKHEEARTRTLQTPDKMVQFTCREKSKQMETSNSKNMLKLKNLKPLTWEFYRTATVTDSFYGLQTVITLIEKAEHCAQCCIYCLLGAAGGGARDVAGRVSPSGNTIGLVRRTGAGFVGFNGIHALLRTCSHIRILSDGLKTRRELVTSVIKVCMHARITPPPCFCSLLLQVETMLKCRARRLLQCWNSGFFTLSRWTCRLQHAVWSNCCLIVAYSGNSYSF